MSEPAIDLLESVWGSIARLGADLTAEQWDTPTECPGWSVRDQVSHIIGLERMLAGLDIEPPGHRGRTRRRCRLQRGSDRPPAIPPRL